MPGYQVMNINSSPACFLFLVLWKFSCKSEVCISLALMHYFMIRACCLGQQRQIVPPLMGKVSVLLYFYFECFP